MPYRFQVDFLKIGGMRGTLTEPPVCRQTGSGIFYLNEVVHYPQHAVDLRRGFVFHGLVHFAEAQSSKRCLLALAFVDRAFDQSDFYLTHCSYWLSVISYWLMVTG